jgi:N6-L-threonylcarbamoyladenine synthase
MQRHLDYKTIGKTRDDAVGEAFDKGAKMLGLGYPGGPAIDRLAMEGNNRFHDFPRAFLKGDTFDFSYSGLKTALLVYLNDKSRQFISAHMSDICASYQAAAVEVLIRKMMRAAQHHDVKSIGVVGGVAANSLLRNWLTKESREQDLPLYLPDFSYCTDNAAMIARAGLQRLSQGIFSEPDLNAVPSLKLS